MKYDKEIEIHMNEIEALMLKTIDLLYKSAYNEAIDDAFKLMSEGDAEIRKLKK